MSAWQTLDTDDPNPDDALWIGDPQAIVEAAALELLERPEWHRRAACRGVGPDVFYATTARGIAQAKALCARCPVQPQCLAASAGEQGLWGGLDEEERRRARARRSA